MSSYESAIRYTTALSRKQRRQKDLRSTVVASAGGGSGPTSGVVTLTGDQNIFGVKHFEDGFSIGGIRFYRSQDGTVYIEGNLVTSGGITAHGANTTTTPSLFDALPIDSRTIKRDANGMLYVDAEALNVSGGLDEEQLRDFLTKNQYVTRDDIPSISGVTYDAVVAALGYIPLSTSGDTITATGRRQLSLQSSTDAQAALWLGTGLEQFTKGGFLQYDYSNGSIALVNFSAMSNSYTGLAGLFIKRDNRITVGDATLSTEYDILHTGNIGQYALPITGGTVSGNLEVLALTVEASNEINGYQRELGTATGNVHLNYRSSGNVTIANGGGNVTVGGTTALDKLHVYGRGRFMMFKNGNHSSIIPEVTALTISTNEASYSGYNTGIGFNALGDYGSLTYKNHIHAWIGLGGFTTIAEAECYPLVFATNGSTTTGTAPIERMRITPEGNVVIGGTTATVRLDVTATSGWATSFKNTNAAVNTSHADGYGMFIASMMPTTSSGYLFRVWQGSLSGASGTGTAIFDVMANNSVIARANFLATGGITAHYTSDERLKTNLRPINAGQMILSLGRVMEFEYINSEVERNSLYKGRHIGLIYQDVKGSALSKMCYEREDGFGSLNYLDTSLKALLVGVAQEHEIRLTEDEREIQAVKEENKALRKEIEYLKQRVA